MTVLDRARAGNALRALGWAGRVGAKSSPPGSISIG
jgi:hypothetical protein